MHKFGWNTPTRVKLKQLIGTLARGIDNAVVQGCITKKLQR